MSKHLLMFSKRNINATSEQRLAAYGKELVEQYQAKLGNPLEGHCSLSSPSCRDNVCQRIHCCPLPAFLGGTALRDSSGMNNQPYRLFMD
jgi:hypothetical protein